MVCSSISSRNAHQCPGERRRYPVSSRAGYVCSQKYPRVTFFRKSNCLLHLIGAVTVSQRSPRRNRPPRALVLLQCAVKAVVGFYPQLKPDWRPRRDVRAKRPLDHVANHLFQFPLGDFGRHALSEFVVSQWYNTSRVRDHRETPRARAHNQHQMTRPVHWVGTGQGGRDPFRRYEQFSHLGLCSWRPDRNGEQPSEDHGRHPQQRGQRDRVGNHGHRYSAQGGNAVFPIESLSCWPNASGYIASPARALRNYFTRQLIER